METAEERHSRGKPIGQTSPYQAMGGLTGFSSLAPGITRMDTSGAGKLLSEEEMNKSITSVDNPFLRSHAQGVFNYKLAVNDTNGNLVVFFFQDKVYFIHSHQTNWIIRPN